MRLLRLTAVLTPSPPRPPDYDWASGAHPSWAESQWIAFELRMFLKPSLGHELSHLVLGVGVTLLAAALVLLAERRAHLLFETPR